MIIDKLESYRTDEDYRAEQAAEDEAKRQLKALLESDLTDLEKEEKKTEIAHHKILAELDILNAIRKNGFLENQLPHLKWKFYNVGTS